MLVGLLKVQNNDQLLKLKKLVAYLQILYPHQSRISPAPKQLGYDLESSPDRRIDRNPLTTFRKNALGTVYSEALPKINAA